MGRLIEADEPGISLTGRRRHMSFAEVTTDNYAERTAKYVPSEVLAAYLSVTSVLSAVDPTDPFRIPASWLFFALCLGVVPLHLRLLAGRKRPPWMHIAISTTAFIIWSYALGGPFELAGIYKAWLGSVLLITFTLLAGLIRPTK